MEGQALVLLTFYSSLTLNEQCNYLVSLFISVFVFA